MNAKPRKQAFRSPTNPTISFADKVRVKSPAKSLYPCERELSACFPKYCHVVRPPSLPCRKRGGARVPAWRFVTGRRPAPPIAGLRPMTEWNTTPDLRIRALGALLQDLLQ